MGYRTSGNVGIAIINHPPFITIFMGGLHHQKWVVYDIAIPTLYGKPCIPMIFQHFSSQIFCLDPVFRAAHSLQRLACQHHHLWPADLGSWDTTVNQLEQECQESVWECLYISGWRYTYPSEKYESHLGWLFPTEWENKNCSKAPTRYGFYGNTAIIDPSLCSQ